MKRALIAAVAAVFLTACGGTQLPPLEHIPGPYTGPYYLESCKTGLLWYAETKGMLRRMKHWHHNSIVLLPSDLALNTAQLKRRCAA